MYINIKINTCDASNLYQPSKPWEVVFYRLLSFSQRNCCGCTSVAVSYIGRYLSTCIMAPELRVLDVVVRIVKDHDIFSLSRGVYLDII